MQQNVLGSNKSLGHRLRLYLANLARSSPARLTLLAFAAAIFVITALLMLPFSTVTRHSPAFVDALFTSTSAVCVTGLSVTPTATYWSTFGQVVIMAGIKIGGLGVTTLASLLALAVSKRIGLTQRLLLTSGELSGSLGQLGALLKAVIIASGLCESLVALFLFPRFLTLGNDPLHSFWYAIFHAISCFNNAGFDILPNSLSPYISDWWMCCPLILGTFMGAIGFPVILDLYRNGFKVKRWSLHTKLTVTTYFSLLFTGVITFICFEYNNATTLGESNWPTRFLAAVFYTTMSHSAGMTTVDPGLLESTTRFTTDALMFIGGGSGGTCGGIKVTTFAVLLLAIAAEARGDRDIEAFKRRIPPAVVRLAVSATMLAAALVGIATVAMLGFTALPLDNVLFEVISAFGTCGLTTGITGSLPPEAKYLLICLMFAGRTGTMTLAAALAMRERRRVIRMAEERPLIG